MHPETQTKNTVLKRRPASLALSLLTLAFLTLTPVHAATDFVRGDGNLDGDVDLADAATLIRFFVDGTSHCPDALDNNDDGLIDLADFCYLLNYFYAFGPEPEPPFPDCGVDETGDDLGCGFYPCPQ